MGDPVTTTVAATAVVGLLSAGASAALNSGDDDSTDVESAAVEEVDAPESITGEEAADASESFTNRWRRKRGQGSTMLTAPETSGAGKSLATTGTPTTPVTKNTTGV